MLYKNVTTKKKKIHKDKLITMALTIMPLVIRMLTVLFPKLAIVILQKNHYTKSIWDNLVV